MWRILATIFLAMFASGLIGLAFNFINLPSDLGFYGGWLMVAAVAWITITVVKKLWKGKL